MAKKIEFEVDGVDYTLEFSRRTQAQMERAGFRLDQLGDQPTVMIPMLFRGAFMMHHPRIKEEMTNHIYKVLGNKEELISELIQCYSDVTETLFEEPEEGKKVAWRKGD